MNDMVYVVLWSWLVQSILGALILGTLLFLAVGDLRLRKRTRGAPNSSILLGWQRVVFDSALLSVMLVDTVIALLSFTPGNSLAVLVGLNYDKLSMVLLAVYLAVNRHWVRQAGAKELASRNTEGPP